MPALVEYAHTTRKTRQKDNKNFHETLSSYGNRKKLIINVFTFYSLIFMLRVLSSAIEPAVRFLRTLPPGCLQQDVVNKNSNF